MAITNANLIFISKKEGVCGIKTDDKHLNPKNELYSGVSSISIPLEKAVGLCKLHRQKHKVRLFSQCWGCLRYSKEEPTKMCFYNENNPAENRGCKFVNRLSKICKKSNPYFPKR